MFVKDVNDSDFARDVIERSKSVPVVVDFWAPWCGPCKVLGQVLQDEINALGGRVELAKVNSDDNQALAAEYQIRSIPAVKAFQNGEVVTEFVGARPATFIRKWLGQLAPSEDRQHLQKASDLIRAGSFEEAVGQLRALLESEEVGSLAAVTLAEVLLMLSRLDEVAPLLDRVDSRSAAWPRVEGLRRRLELAVAAAEFGGEQASRPAVEADPTNLEARFALAGALVGRTNYTEALEQLLKIVSLSRKFRDDAARHAMLALFEYLGPDHELSQGYRRKLQMVLF